VAGKNRNADAAGARGGASANLAPVLPKLFRSWRVLVLAWAVLLAPQASMVHALSHSLPGAPHSGEGDKQKQGPAKVCDSCLAFAQLGAALPSSFDWLVLDLAAPEHAHVVAIAAPQRAASVYDARAPPADLT
jgi:hypothetical protein